MPFATPSELADAATDDAWDIGLIGAEPARAETIAFTAAYTEIEATYLVPPGSSLRRNRGCRPGTGSGSRSLAGSAYDLFLSRNIERAELVRASGLDGSFDLFLERQLDALAGLRPRLLSDVERLSGSRILDGQFTAVQQAVGTPRRASAGPRSSPSSSRKRRRAGSCSASSTGTASAASRWRPPRSGSACVTSDWAAAHPVRRLRWSARPAGHASRGSAQPSRSNR